MGCLRYVNYLYLCIWIF